MGQFITACLCVCVCCLARARVGGLVWVVFVYEALKAIDLGSYLRLAIEFDACNARQLQLLARVAASKARARASFVCLLAGRAPRLCRHCKFMSLLHEDISKPQCKCAPLAIQSESSGRAKLFGCARGSQFGLARTQSTILPQARQDCRRLFHCDAPSKTTNCIWGAASRIMLE